MATGSDRMCGRAGCVRVGQPTDSRRCPICGFVTEQWDPERAERLRPPGRPAERSVRTGIPVSTADQLPGWTVTEYIGEVFGLVVRSRGLVPDFGARLKSLAGGELGTMTTLLRQSRADAVERLVDEAEYRGADAVIGMRFDVTTMGAEWTEVCAYGTAVKATPIVPAAGSLEL